MGSHSTPRGRMPPVQHVAFAELVRCCTQNMLTGQSWFGMHEPHYVLQLVAKSKCSAGLIKAGSAPKATAQGLIEQPAVCHQVYRWVRSLYVNRAEGSRPILRNSCQRSSASLDAA